MESNKEQRAYRRIFSGQGLVYFTSKVKQTDLCIGATLELHKQAEESIIKYRKQVEAYVRRQPVFLHALNPVTPLLGAPSIVAQMCRAAELAGVGPMAAIAGAISEYVASDLLKYTNELVVENGGDLYIAGTKEKTVGLYAGNSVFTGKIGLKIYPEELPLAICTSSGTVGHSLSFGCADAVTILSKDACLADATATAIGNMIKSTDDIDDGLKKAQTISGLLGALIIVGEQIGAWGQVKLVKL